MNIDTIHEPNICVTELQLLISIKCLKTHHCVLM